MVCKVFRRTIPTRVGRTADSTRYAEDPPDHPHAGGENVVFDVEEEDLFGPSPRGWGELERIEEVSHPARTIPTRVGRTTRW